MSAEMKTGEWGLCAAYGCPLFGSLGRADEWMCFCHYDAAATHFQAITKIVRDLEPVTASTLDIRRFYGTDDWPAAYRGIQHRLIAAGRHDLLLGDADCSPNTPRAFDEDSPSTPGTPVVRMWLARLENLVVRQCNELKSVRVSRYGSPTVPTAKITGPTHASAFSRYAERDEGTS